MADKSEVESFLRMAGRAADVASATSDPWLKAQWLEISGAYKDVAQECANAAESGRGGAVERGKDNA